MEIVRLLDDVPIMYEMEVRCSHSCCIGLVIQASHCTEIPLVLKRAVSQTSDLMQIQNSAGAVLGGIDSNGVPYGSLKSIAVTNIILKRE